MNWSSWNGASLVSVIMGLLFGGCGLGGTTGCASAKFFGGEAAGENPGVHFRSGGLFSGPEVSVTSNANVSAKHITFKKASEKETIELVMDEPAFGQDAATVMREEPAKIAAIMELQRVQVQLAEAHWQGVSDVARTVVPLLAALATAGVSETASGIALTLPNGFSIGANKATKPQDVAAAIREAYGAMQALTTSTPRPPAIPASATPASASTQPALPAPVVQP